MGGRTRKEGGACRTARGQPHQLGGRSPSAAINLLVCAGTDRRECGVVGESRRADSHGRDGGDDKRGGWDGSSPRAVLAEPPERGKGHASEESDPFSGWLRRLPRRLRRRGRVSDRRGPDGRLPPAGAVPAGRPGGGPPQAGTVIASVGPAARPAATIGPAVSVWQPVQRVTAAKPAAPPAGEIARVSDPPSTGETVRASIDMPQPIAVAGDAPARRTAGRCLNEPHLEPQPIVVEPPHPLVAPSAAPHEFAKQPLPPYVVEPPDILLVEATQELTEGFPAHRRPAPRAARRHASASAPTATSTWPA